MTNHALLDRIDKQRSQIAALEKELKQKDAEQKVLLKSNYENGKRYAMVAIREGVEKLSELHNVKNPKDWKGPWIERKEVLALIDKKKEGEIDRATAKFMEDWARGNKEYFRLEKPKKKSKNEHPGCSAPWY